MCDDKGIKLRSLLKLDQSALCLVLSNIVAIVVAVLAKWDLSEVVWIYWGQSVVIGIFNWRRILCLKHFSTEGMTHNDRPVEPTKEAQRETAWFFLAHYGGFHLVYLIFLLMELGGLSRNEMLGIAGCVVMFGFNHWFSFRHNLERDLSRKPNIGNVMFFPYARILPMHLTIIFGFPFGGGEVGVLVLFLVLKTVADLIMHLIEHKEEQEASVLPGTDKE